MVFDWFRRSSAPPNPETSATDAPETPAPETPTADQPAAEQPAAAAPASIAAPAAAADPQAAAGLQEPTPAVGAEVAGQAAPSPGSAPLAAAGIDQEALSWAREAYARLKAQQEAAGAAQPAAPATSAPVTAKPAPTEPAPAAPPAPEFAAGSTTSPLAAPVAIAAAAPDVAAVAEVGQPLQATAEAEPLGDFPASTASPEAEPCQGEAAESSAPEAPNADPSLDRPLSQPTVGSEPAPAADLTAAAPGPEPAEGGAGSAPGWPAAEEPSLQVQPVAPPPAGPPAPVRAVAPPIAVTPQLAQPELGRPEAASPEPAASAVSPPALSLLEQAAALRQERLRQLTSPGAMVPGAMVPGVEAPGVEADPAAAALAAGTAAAEGPLPPRRAVEADAEPSLGAFDDAFTWSAEVLAAQGRRVEDVSIEEIDWLTRLRRGLEKTRRGFVTQLLETLGDDPLSPEVLDDLETTLLQADVGVQATDLVLEALRRRLNEEVVDPGEGLRFLKEQLRQLLDAPTQRDGRPLLAPSRDRLNIWLLVGVNGVGKTTTLGKLANLASRSGYSCLIAAADTFRAAAVEQVTVWGERSGVPVIANPSPHADPAAVVFDAIGAARSRGSELVLVDTAGRLQTKHNLMEELAKVRRIVDRLAPEAAVESLLVLDASQGQNGLRQAMAFAPAAGLTGVVLTKLDGSARGGVAIAVAHDAGLPIRFVGAGEGVRDLRPFNSFEFVEALLSG